MSILQTLVSKNKNSVKVALILFFATAILLDLIERFQYRDIKEFKIGRTNIELCVLIILIFLNPKGIRIIVSSTFLFLIYFLISTMFFSHQSNLSLSLLFRKLFYEINVDSRIIYLSHLGLYLTFLFLMMKPEGMTNKATDDLLDQK